MAWLFQNIFVWVRVTLKTAVRLHACLKCAEIFVMSFLSFKVPSTHSKNLCGVFSLLPGKNEPTFQGDFAERLPLDLRLKAQCKGRSAMVGRLRGFTHLERGLMPRTDLQSTLLATLPRAYLKHNKRESSLLPPLTHKRLFARRQAKSMDAVIANYRFPTQTVITNYQLPIATCKQCRNQNIPIVVFLTGATRQQNADQRTDSPCGD